MISSALDKLPEGWLVSSPEITECLEQQLARELSRGHLLEDKAVRIVANRHGSDDVLCQRLDDSTRFTVIHLTWSASRQTDSDHPTVESDGSFDDFLAYERKILGR